MYGYTDKAKESCGVGEYQGKMISTHKDINEGKFAKLDGIGPSKELPSNLLFNLTVETY